MTDKKRSEGNPAPSAKTAGTLCLAATLALAMVGASPGADKNPAPQAGKSEVRNNSASLLAQLLNEEKNLDQILIIKHDAGAAGDLAKAVSKQAGEGAKELEKLAKADSTLHVDAIQLPPGEVAVRASLAKTKEHELLSSSGAAFQLNLLLTQVQALNYESHLAGLAAENSASADQANVFRSLETSLDGLYRQAFANLRVVVRK